METKKYVIDMKLPSLNDYIRVCRCNKYEAAKYEKPVRIHFHWIEGNKKRDLDGICFAKKFILDAMQKYGKLKNDNRKCVTGFIDTFEYAQKSKVILEI